MVHFFFSFVSSIQSLTSRKWFYNKLVDLNPETLASKVTTVSTVPQPLPSPNFIYMLFISVILYSELLIFTLFDLSI